MEKQRPIYCLICLFCLHCLDCLRCCKVCGHWTYPVRQSQEVLTNVKYDFWLNWLFLFSGLQRFEKNPCIYVWIARWKASDFEGSPTWPFPDDQLGVHLPPSQSLGPQIFLARHRGLVICILRRQRRTVEPPSRYRLKVSDSPLDDFKRSASYTLAICGLSLM